MRKTGRAERLLRVAPPDFMADDAGADTRDCRCYGGYCLLTRGRAEG